MNAYLLFSSNLPLGFKTKTTSLFSFFFLTVRLGGRFGKGGCRQFIDKKEGWWILGLNKKLEEALVSKAIIKKDLEDAKS